MNLSYQDNIPAFNAALLAFLRFYRLSVPAGLRIQGRLLGERLIQFTPPIRRDRTPMSQGKAAVKRDIFNAIRPLKASNFRSPEIRKLVRERKYAALGVVFSRMVSAGDLHNAHVVPFDPHWHRIAQKSRGHVTKYMRVLTPDATEANAYVKKIQGHVGRGKGGWAAAVKHLGGNVPDWVAKHASTGSFTDGADHSLNPFIKMVNQSEWATQGDEDRIVANALRARARDIHKEIAKTAAGALRRARLTR